MQVMGNFVAPLPLTGTYTVSEAAWASGTDRNFVHGEINKKIVSVMDGKRRLLDCCDLMYFRIVRDIGASINVDLRKRLYMRVRDCYGHKLDRRTAFETFFINLHMVSIEVARKLAIIQEAQDCVTSDPAVRGGEPVLKGTRIPPRVIGKLVSGGMDERLIASEFGVSSRMVEMAVLFDTLYPRKGRPSDDSIKEDLAEIGSVARYDIQELGEFRDS